MLFGTTLLTLLYPSNTTSKNIALLYKNKYIIDSITSHRGNRSNFPLMQFFVRWSGYSPADDTWEPWSSLRRIIQLHDYLRLINLSKYIPLAFK